MKKLILGTLLMGCASLAHALAFTVAANPGQPLPTTILPGQTLTAFYTVTNNTLVTRNSSYVKHFPTNTTQVIGPGLCGTTFNLTPGGSCLLQLSITGPTNGKTTPLMICFPGGLTCAGTNDTLDVTGSSSSSSGSLVRAVAGGPVGSTELLFESSVDDLTTWQPQTITLSATTLSMALDCVGSGDNALCVAGLSTATFAGGTPIRTSTNGGKTWTPAPELSYSSEIDILGVSCTNSWFCVAAGTQLSISVPQASYMAIRSNTTGLWTNSFTPPPSINQFQGTACAANGTFCLAVAGTSSSVAPYILQSTTPSIPASWVPATLPGTLSASALSTASCNTDGGICMAAGGTNLIQTLNKGGIWSVAPAFTATLNLNLTGSSCTDTGTSTWCAVVGSDSAVPVLGGQIWQTLNKGTSWSPVPFSPILSASSVFAEVSCTGTQANGLCVAVGQNGTGLPLLAISQNAGAWTVVPNGTITGFSSTAAALNNVSCTGTGTTAVCAAVGVDTSSSTQSLLIKTYDGGNTWAVDTASAQANATFNAVTLTGGQ